MSQATTKTNRFADYESHDVCVSCVQWNVVGAKRWLECNVTRNGKTERYIVAEHAAANVAKIAERWPVSYASVIADMLRCAREN